jgi:serine/threonine protein kinase
VTGFEVTRKVADGSAVEAFLARAGGEQVLVQVSRPELAADAELSGKFAAILLAATQLDHPSLLGAKKVEQGRDGRFLAMSAPLSGRTAEQQLAERGVLSTTEAVRWGIAICDALEYLHGRGLVHGNLAPSNVFLDGDAQRPTVRLLDTAFLLFRGSRSLTTSKQLVRPEYLSPERAAGTRASTASDVYGLGVLLFELLTGAPPFKTRELHLSAATPVLPMTLRAWKVVFDGCFTRDPALRFPSVAAVRGALGGVVEAELQPVTPALQATPPPIGREVAIGDVLGNYEVLAVLGEGGMGKVYLAEHVTLGRQVALKVLRSELGKFPELVQRFVQEAQAVNRARHPNIVEVFDLVQDQGRTWFVMELLEGKSLRALGKERPLSVWQAVGYVRAAGEALAVAHGVGVVHRDIKPDNLFVTREGLVKVLDFGVARVRDSQKLVPRQTQVGQVVGTPLWMSPGQVLGHDVDAKTDVYALATVLYVLLVKHYPFEGATPQQVVMKRLQVAATAIGDTTFGGEPIPRALQKLVMRALSRDVAPRPTMGELVTALREFEAEPVFEAIDLELESGRGRWRWLLSPLVPIAAGAAWWLLRAHH